MLLADHVEELLLEDLQFNLNKVEYGDSFYTVLQAHITDIEDRNGFTFQIIAEIISLGDRDLNLKALRVINKYIHIVEDLLVKGQRSGSVRRDIDTRMAATLFFHMIQGLISIWALNSYSFDINKEFKRLWCIYRNGIAPSHSISISNYMTKNRLCFS